MVFSRVGSKDVRFDREFTCYVLGWVARMCGSVVILRGIL